MKRSFLFAAVAALAVAAAAQADPLAGAYGNTVVRTMPDGTKATTYFNADKTWEEHNGAVTTKGTFAMKDDTHVCMTQTDPAPADPAKATTCNEAADHKVGDTWTGTTPDGKPVSLTITAGR